MPSLEYKVLSHDIVMCFLVIPQRSSVFTSPPPSSAPALCLSGRLEPGLENPSVRHRMSPGGSCAALFSLPSSLEFPNVIRRQRRCSAWCVRIHLFSSLRKRRCLWIWPNDVSFHLLCSSKGNEGC